MCIEEINMNVLLSSYLCIRENSNNDRLVVLIDNLDIKCNNLMPLDLKYLLQWSCKLFTAGVCSK